MLCAFITLVATLGGTGFVAWLGLRRLAAHARRHPEATRHLIDHVLVPLFADDADEKQPAEGEATPSPESEG